MFEEGSWGGFSPWFGSLGEPPGWGWQVVCEGLEGMLLLLAPHISSIGIQGLSGCFRHGLAVTCAAGSGNLKFPVPSSLSSSCVATGVMGCSGAPHRWGYGSPVLPQ